MARGTNRFFIRMQVYSPRLAPTSMKISGLIAAAPRNEIFQLGIFGDFGGDFEAADIGRAHQKLGAEIAADEITAAMDDLVIWTVEAAPDLIAPT
jgi:ABC-type glucose/galactose transport system permease subunit